MSTLVGPWRVLSNKRLLLTGTPHLARFAYGLAARAAARHPDPQQNRRTVSLCRSWHGVSRPQDYERVGYDLPLSVDSIAHHVVDAENITVLDLELGHGHFVIDDVN